MVTNSTKFDPSKYLTKLKGKDYLEVKWRLLWLRSEHPDADISTELVQFGPELAVIKATVKVPGQGSATGHATQCPADFNEWLEKCETKAVGRALAMLGYGTQFATELEWERDDNGQVAHVADAPVERPQHGSAASTQPVPAPAPLANGNGNGHGKAGEPLASPAQVKAIYVIGHSQGLSEQDVDERVRQQFGAVPAGLTKRQASQMIDALQGKK